MKLIYLADLYPAYVRELYGTRPLLELESYEHQLACLQAHGFAWNGAWQPALAPLGYEVMDVYPNAEPLQRTWAWQYDRRLLPPADLRRIAVEQVRRFAPEVVLFDQYDEVLLDAIRAEVPGVRLIVGWVGGTLPDTNIWSKLDLVLSCAPESVEALRALGAHAEHMHHGFNHTLLPRIRSGARTVDVGFFGQIVTSGSFHRERERFFERLVAAGIPLELHSPSADFGLRDDWIWLLRLGAWGTARTLKAARVPDGAIGRIPLVRRAARWSHRPSMPVSRTLKPHLRPALYGIDMLQAISESRVTLNVHADTSIRYASNMRLFETTGVGSCLLTDWRDNIPELFTPDKEIVAYRSPEECVERIRWLLGHPAEAEAIGRAAQARTLRDHTYARRAEALDAVVRRSLARGSATASRSVSTGYKRVDAAAYEDIARRLRDSWKDSAIPRRQRELVDDQLTAYRRGEPIPVFDALVEILQHNVQQLAGARLLEIGCSSGYYSDVFSIKGLGVRYEGCDYSEGFVELARRLYPGTVFSVEDAIALRYGSGSFDIVVSGGCLLHIPEYEKAIAETARVTNRFAVFHRTPVMHTANTTVHTKRAYGVETLEIHFKEQQLVRLFSRYGLRVVDVNTHGIGWNAEAQDAMAMKTYLCEKAQA